MTEDKVMVIYLPEVHESIAGIIAGKVREKYHHPVFILTKGEDGVKGSGRSIEAYHMYDAMTQVKHFLPSTVDINWQQVCPCGRRILNLCGLLSIKTVR